jgi:putative transposase
MVTPAQQQASAARRADNQQRGRERGYDRVRARPIYSGRSYKVTKRCDERRFYLAPGEHPEELVGLIGYCLAYCAEQFGIEIHAAAFMSNHYHIDLTDPHANLVEFKRTFNSFVARALNARRKRFGSFWDRSASCDTQRPTDDESFMDLVYTLANPVTAGLVRHARLWPGFTTAGWRFGETRSFRRPKWFFNADRMPDVVELTLTRPHVFEELSDDELYERVADEVRRREREVQAEFRRTNRRFVGLDKLRSIRHDKVPTSFEERFGITPKVAASCRWKRLAQLQRDREWELQYALARARLLAGADAVFPAGTYLLRRLARVAVAEQLIA